MKKWLMGLCLGGFLGVFDGLTAPLSAPETLPELPGIVIGSIVKGIITGVMIGFFSQKVRSMPLGLVFGLLVGAFWAFLVAYMQYVQMNRVYFWQIMLPGSVLGLIVGFATQKYGATRTEPVETAS